MYERKRKIALSLVEVLLAYGAVAEHVDRKGVTPLYVAATSGYRICADLLMRAGGRVDRADLNGFTILKTVKAMRFRAQSFHECQRFDRMIAVLTQSEDELSAAGNVQLRNGGSFRASPTPLGRAGSSTGSTQTLTRSIRYVYVGCQDWHIEHCIEHGIEHDIGQRMGNSDILCTFSSVKAA